MKKIVIIISVLILAVAGASYVYFKNISSPLNSSVKVLKMLPKDAAIVFEFKNEDSFYDIFKDFTLFADVVGKSKILQLSELKDVLDNEEISSAFEKSNFYFSLHQTKNKKADLLILAPLASAYMFENSAKDFIKKLSLVIKTNKISSQRDDIYTISLKNNKPFYFCIYKSVFIGSTSILMVDNTLHKQTNDKEIPTGFSIESARNKNAIANLYINYAELPKLINTFSENNKDDLFQYFNASASLNINYQSNAFMFNGISTPDLKVNQYQNLFLNQTPGELSFRNILPATLASFIGYYTSNPNRFQKDLHQFFVQKKVYENLQNQINAISKAHSFLLEKEFRKIIGNDFGTFLLSNGEKLGFVNINNTQRASFILSLISSDYSNSIRKLTESNIFYYFLGDPFKSINKPFYTIINNYIVFSNNVNALRNVYLQYEQQNNLLQNTDYNAFQQYLTNRGNIFLYVNNKNSRSIIKRFFTKEAYENSISDEFNLRNWYGFSLQLSSDKDKFYTNLYLNKVITTRLNNENAEAINLNSLRR